MYKDYLDSIGKFYRKSERASCLPQLLLQPTNKKLKDLCVSVYQERFELRDQGMLKIFFDIHGQSDILKAIEKVDIEKFKPLVNYLKKGLNTGTEEKNIELLGWLLNFSKRPYDDKYDYTNHEEPLSKAKIKSPKRPKLEDSAEDAKRTPHWKLLTGILIFLGLSVTIYFSKRKQEFGVIPSGQKGCMVWADFQYERVSCDSPSRGRLVFPLEKNTLDNLYRITQPDTITEKDIGKLWYQKRTNDSVDYYTAGGRDPSDPDRDLKRLSKHIFLAHISKKPK